MQNGGLDSFRQAVFSNFLSIGTFLCHVPMILEAHKHPCGLSGALGICLDTPAAPKGASERFLEGPRGVPRATWWLPERFQASLGCYQEPPGGACSKMLLPLQTKRVGLVLASFSSGSLCYIWLSFCLMCSIFACLVLFSFVPQVCLVCSMRYWFLAASVLVYGLSLIHI